MAKTKHTVIKATTKPIEGILVGGRYKKFKANGTIELDDAGEAMEVNDVLGHRKGTGEVVVTRDSVEEPGHNYRFGPLMSQQARENYDHIFRKKRSERKTTKSSEE